MSETMSAKVKVVSSRNIKVSNPTKLREEIRQAKIKAIADGYKFDDRCAHIRSVGNGL